MSARRLAVVADFAEEEWPSMDLATAMLLAGLDAHRSALAATRVRPELRWRFARLPIVGRGRFARNADRLANRLWDYPRALAREVARFDLFHVADHSYAHLVHGLPAERTGVFCHDLDTFRCLLEPEREPRPRWFRAIARRALDGLAKAAVVFHSTAEVGRAIERAAIVDAKRLVRAPYGVAPELSASPNDDDARVAEGLLAPIGGAPFLLHVGSTIARKRVDVLLETFAAVRAARPELALVQVGGRFAAEHEAAIARLGIARSVLQIRGVSASALAAIYRGARLVLLTSEREGFGLPLIEALACGAIALASDLPVLREVGGDAALYAPVADVAAWTEATIALLRDPSRAPARDARLAQAARFTWSEHARIVAEAYAKL